MKFFFVILLSGFDVSISHIFYVELLLYFTPVGCN